MPLYSRGSLFCVIVFVSLLGIFGHLSFSSFTILTEQRNYSSNYSYVNPTKSFPCNDYTPETTFSHRGKYWVLYNYFKATKSFGCDESVTYATHADWTYLDNLTPLLERWQGPLSIAIYSPGTDYFKAVQSIQYLRECSSSPLVKELVTFHLFFDDDHIPNSANISNPDSIPVNCKDLADSVTFGEGLTTYKKANELLYPVNVARNIAREMATTHYLFVSDIELYPSPNLIPNFLEMVSLEGPHSREPTPPKVFVLPIFEVDAKKASRLPNDKSELIEMLGNESAIIFHKHVCSHCHQVPKAQEWQKAAVTEGLGVFHVGKRVKPFHIWEPIFIGTKADPEFDERLSYEGLKDKMVNVYLMCVLDYEFHVLDNAFLVHRPGIKRIGKGPKKRNWVVANQNQFIKKTIVPELTQIYGKREGCWI